MVAVAGLVPRQTILPVQLRCFPTFLHGAGVATGEVKLGDDGVLHDSMVAREGRKEFLAQSDVLQAGVVGVAARAPMVDFWAFAPSRRSNRKVG